MGRPENKGQEYVRMRLGDEKNTRDRDPSKLLGCRRVLPLPKDPWKGRLGWLLNFGDLRRRSVTGSTYVSRIFGGGRPPEDER